MAWMAGPSPVVTDEYPCMGRKLEDERSRSRREAPSAVKTATIGQILHASCVVFGETGILVRGPSGSGKSTLVSRLIAWAEERDRFARLVADDRTRIVARAGRIVARAVAPLEGLLEVRGLGLVGMPHEPSCVVRCVIHLLDEASQRLPDESDRKTELAGIRLPCLRVYRPETSIVTGWLDRGKSDTTVTVR